MWEIGTSVPRQSSVIGEMVGVAFHWSEDVAKSDFELCDKYDIYYADHHSDQKMLQKSAFSDFYCDCHLSFVRAGKDMARMTFCWSVDLAKFDQRFDRWDLILIINILIIFYNIQKIVQALGVIVHQRNRYQLRWFRLMQTHKRDQDLQCDNGFFNWPLNHFAREPIKKNPSHTHVHSIGGSSRIENSRSRSSSHASSSMDEDISPFRESSQVVFLGVMEQ